MNRDQTGCARGSARTLRTIALLGGLLLVPAARSAAQISYFDWTLQGSSQGSGTLVGETMQITGPDSLAFSCTDENETWFETTAPTDAMVVVEILFTNMDAYGCHWDAPIWVVNGVVFQVPEEAAIFGAPEALECWLSATYKFEFPVTAGDTFGLGAWSVDCAAGPGVVDVVSMQFVTGGWFDLGAELDPRLRFTLTGQATGDVFGSAVADAGDVNGDGVSDVIVGAPYEAPSGAARVFSGTDGSLLWQGFGATTLATFGYGVAGVGDVDGDDVPDFAVGAPFDDQPFSSSGAVRVYSGATGLLLFTVGGSQSAGFLGFTIAGVGDLDGDGFGDVLTGEPAHSGSVARAVVVGGPDGHLILSFDAPQSGTMMGRSLAPYADYDGDGTDDFVLGAPQTNLLGQGFSFSTTDVFIASGADGSILQTLSGTGNFGFAVAVLQDMDADTLPELAVGAPSWFGTGPDEVGRVAIVSPGSGLELAELIGTQPDGFFGAALAVADDLDGDGLMDLAVGAPFETASAHVGVTRVYSVPALTLKNIVTAKDAELGRALAVQPRVGSDALIIGGPATQADTGHASLYADFAAPAPPRLAGIGPLTPASPITLRIIDAPALTTTWLVIGVSAVNAPFKGGLLVPHADVLVPLPIPASGTLNLNSTWPSLMPPWWSVWLQTWTPHASGPQGWIASNALRAVGNP